MSLHLPLSHMFSEESDSPLIFEGCSLSAALSGLTFTLSSYIASSAWLDPVLIWGTPRTRCITGLALSQRASPEFLDTWLDCSKIDRLCWILLSLPYQETVVHIWTI